MTGMQRRSLSNRLVDRLSAAGKDVIYWDRYLPGFGVRVYPSGAKVYLVQTRGPEGSKRATVGRHGVISAERARRRAATIVARIKAGEAPKPAPKGHAETGGTIADLAGRYLREHVELRCKPGTAKGYRHTLEKYILPALGHLPVSELRSEHVADLHFRLRKTPGVANEAVAALSRMLNRAEAWGLAPAGGNPCRQMAKPRSRRRERFLTEEEFRRLGKALDTVESEGGVPLHAAAALRLLMLTGCRSSEILTLRWEDVFLATYEFRLPDSKTGPRTVPLSSAAAGVLADLPRLADNPWVIAGREPGTRLSHLAHYWYRVRERAGLDNLRIHDLRHSFASRALALGESLSMIGRLLGHTKIQTTARYAHLARDSVGESAARVAANIGADLRGDALLWMEPGMEPGLQHGAAERVRQLRRQRRALPKRRAALGGTNRTVGYCCNFATCSRVAGDPGELALAWVTTLCFSIAADRIRMANGPMNGEGRLSSGQESASLQGNPNQCLRGCRVHDLSLKYINLGSRIVSVDKGRIAF